MVTVLEVDPLLPSLFSKEEVASLETLMSSYKGELPALAGQILTKENHDFYDKRYLSWLKHSLAFKLRQTSPRKILESWTLDVTEMLSEKWVETFSEEDVVSVAFFGKLGSGELNLSSDIDISFFGDNNFRLTKIRNYINKIGDLNKIPSGFKVDLDLRPGGANSPMICSADRLGDHLWNSSDPWERYSYTRMDVQLGQSALISKIREIRDKFCYRKYLSSDFFHSFVEMRKDYRLENSSKSMNVKLGPGGIRDIELFVQTFQILHGGKDAKYRGLSTFELMDLFIREGINTDIFEKLRVSYAMLRQAEGELHALNESGGFDWVKDETKFSADVFASAYEANKIIEDYVDSSKNIFGTTKNLRVSSFKDKVEERLGVESIALRQKALSNLDQYFLSRKKQFQPYFSAILSQDKVFEAFLDLLKYSDYGCQILSRRPSLLDVFLLRRSAPDFDSEEDFLNSLSDVKMVQRILASSEFKKNKDIKVLGDKVTSSYEVILKEIVNEEDGVDFLFFGKMATGEMGLSSDLDFIMVTDEEKVPTKKAREIYRKLSYLTVFGPLVPYDMDGGPMGRATPLLMTWQAAENFLKNKAEPWQKLMYLKQRRLFSDKELLYLDGPMEEEQIVSLFEILRERLIQPKYKKDPYKLNPGGLFHTEFVTGALLLRFGVQPEGGLKMSELLEKLEMMTFDKKLFKWISMNYYQIAAKREEALIEGSDYKEVDQDILAESLKALEAASDKFLFSLKVSSK